MLCLCSAQVREGIDVGALIIQAMGEAELHHKEMADAQGYAEPSVWHKALKGQAPLDLWKLRHLHQSRAHMVFWSIFFSKFASALIARSFNQMFDGFRMARAEIAAHDARASEKRSA